MAFTQTCTKCQGQVIDRMYLEGTEKHCLSCGFNQVPIIIPDEVLAMDSEDFQRRNRGDFSAPPYPEYRSKSGWAKKQYEQTKRKQKVTIEDIETWNEIKEELDLKNG